MSHPCPVPCSSTRPLHDPCRPHLPGLLTDGRSGKLLKSWGVLLTVMVFLTAAAPVQGAPVWGEIFQLEQPDGRQVDVRIWGDEFYRVVESLDGYTLVRDPESGEICYARLSMDSHDLISTRVRCDAVSGEELGLAKHLRIDPEVARSLAAAVRSEANAREEQFLQQLGIERDRIEPPCTGRVQGICLIIDFVDEVGTVPPIEISQYCNQSGYSGYGNHGSVRDYFYDISDGNLIYTNYVPAVYYRAQRPKSYYDDCSATYGERAVELVQEALNDLDSQGFDFSNYDSNGDGIIDAINCFYAGSTQCGWAHGLWPHSGWVEFSADGVEAFRYQITGLPGVVHLGVFCHENGHMICFWPDLYDYDGDSSGVGFFCVMCAITSQTNPGEPCAYMKYIAGWTDTSELDVYQQDIVVPSVSNTIYKYSHPTLDNEYYLIENRQQVDRDALLPDAGLAIWHIDTEGDNSNQHMTPESHYLVTLVQADGNWDLEHHQNNGDQHDLWKAPVYTECTPETDPNTNWWDGSSSGLFVLEISESTTEMTFTFDPGGIADVAGNSQLPHQFRLFPNAPNPFNPQTTIQYELPVPARIWLKIYDLFGRQVRILRAGEVENAGDHRVIWNGRDGRGQSVASGRYFYRLEAGDFVETRMMVLVR